MPTALRNVRYQGQSGKHVLASSFSGFDPTVWSGRAVQEGAHSIPTRATLGAGWVAAADAKTSSTTRRTGTVAANRLIRSPCLRTGRFRDREAEPLGLEKSKL